MEEAYLSKVGMDNALAVEVGGRFLVEEEVICDMQEVSAQESAQEPCCTSPQRAAGCAGRHKHRAEGF